MKNEKKRTFFDNSALLIFFMTYKTNLELESKKNLINCLKYNFIIYV